MNDKKILNEILKETYYKDFYNKMKNKNKNELIKIYKKTLYVFNNISNKEIIENENLKDLKHYELYNKLQYTTTYNLFILRYLLEN